MIKENSGKTLPKNSFFLKSTIVCPACKKKFNKEVMRSGQGRLISLEMRSDLRRVYKFSAKYGIVHPLIYNALVCPYCYFATLEEDFNLKNGFEFEKIKSNFPIRKKMLESFGLPVPNFNETRTIESGMMALFLASTCYSFCTYPSYKEFKQGICALRASWCCDDLALETKHKDANFDKLAVHFRYLAYVNYVEAQDTMYKGKSKFSEINNFGPDLDTNYGYMGFIYVYSYLTMYFLNLSKTKRSAYEKLNKVQIYLSKIFGFGRSSKEKPGPLLEKAKEFYEIVHEIMVNLREDLSITELDSIEAREEEISSAIKKP